MTVDKPGSEVIREFANAAGWEWLDRPRELHIGRRFGHIGEDLLSPRHDGVAARSLAMTTLGSSDRPPFPVYRINCLYVRKRFLLRGVNG